MFFFSTPKVLFVCEMGAFFLLKMCFFFPWKGAFFKVLFLTKSTMIPAVKLDKIFHLFPSKTGGVPQFERVPQFE